jgi:hypothetical protein
MESAERYRLRTIWGSDVFQMILTPWITLEVINYLCEFALRTTLLDNGISI